MFATLVLELPSEYQGAELSVWSPLTPNKKKTYAFNGGNVKQRKTRSSSKPGLHFAAFYADCYHEVSELTSGSRAALVYHLTAAPVQHPLLRHLREPNLLPPQPADESVALELSKMVKAFADEGDEDYPCTWDQNYPDDRRSYQSFVWPGKPKKLNVVLSHHYTPASLTGIKALKGSDRSIAELICAAAYKNPNDTDSLARLAAKSLVEDGGERYASEPDNLHAFQLVSDEFNDGNNSIDGPFFDACISLVVITDCGEGDCLWPSYCEKRGNTTSWTTGPLVWITNEILDLGPKKHTDITADYHPSYFGGQEEQGPPYDYFGPLDNNLDPAYDIDGPIMYGVQQLIHSEGRGNHSLPLYSHELLFASEATSTEFRESIEENGKHIISNFGDDKGVKKLEFREYCYYSIQTSFVICQ